MKTFYLTTVMLLVGLLSFAQSDSTNTNNKQFHTYYGLQVPDISELNSVFGLSNYPQLNSNNFSVGLGMVNFSRKKIVFQQELFVYSQSRKNDSITSSIRSISFGQSLFGYSYVNNKNFRMYSSFGLTYMSTTVKAIKEIPSSTQFNQYASAIGNQLEMTSNNFLADITTHLTYSIKMPDTKNRLILGIRAAYYLPFENSKWTMNKTKLDNGPNINPGGYSLNFVLGFSY
ncbi:MAG: hypothetical protein ACOZCO_03175 [Bacteroidota bacterium]